MRPLTTTEMESIFIMFGTVRLFDDAMGDEKTYRRKVLSIGSVDAIRNTSSSTKTDHEPSQSHLLNNVVFQTMSTKNRSEFIHKRAKIIYPTWIRFIIKGARLWKEVKKPDYAKSEGGASLPESTICERRIEKKYFRKYHKM